MLEKKELWSGYVLGLSPGSNVVSAGDFGQVTDYV